MKNQRPKNQRPENQRPKNQEPTNTKVKNEFACRIWATALFCTHCNNNQTFNFTAYSCLHTVNTVNLRTVNFYLFISGNVFINMMMTRKWTELSNSV
jgi:hypothetical protein